MNAQVENETLLPPAARDAFGPVDRSQTIAEVLWRDTTESIRAFTHPQISQRDYLHENRACETGTVPVQRFD